MRVHSVVCIISDSHNVRRSSSFFLTRKLEHKTGHPSNYIKTKPLHPSQKLLRENADGSCVFKITVVMNFEMFSVFMSYGPGVKILSPRNAMEYMKDKLHEAAELYDAFIGEGNP